MAQAHGMIEPFEAGQVKRPKIHDVTPVRMTVQVERIRH